MMGRQTPGLAATKVALVSSMLSAHICGWLDASCDNTASYSMHDGNS